MPSTTMSGTTARTFAPVMRVMPMVALLFLSAISLAQDTGRSPAANSTLYLHATLIDTNRGVVRPNMSLLIRAGNIQAVDASELRQEMT